MWPSIRRRAVTQAAPLTPHAFPLVAACLPLGMQAPMAVTNENGKAAANKFADTIPPHPLIAVAGQPLLPGKAFPYRLYVATLKKLLKYMFRRRSTRPFVLCGRVHSGVASLLRRWTHSTFSSPHPFILTASLCVSHSTVVCSPLYF